MRIPSIGRRRLPLLAILSAALLFACRETTEPDPDPDPDPDPSLIPSPVRVFMGEQPYGIGGAPASALYVSRLSNGQTTRVDGVTRVPGVNIAVGDTPTDVAINPAGTRAYVANQYGQSVSVINTATNAVVATFAVTGNPFKVAVSPDGASLYVGTNAGRAYKLNATTGAVLGSVITGATPFGFAFGASTRLYISTWDEGTVLEVDAGAMAVLRTFVTGGIAQELAISDDLRELYVANEALGRVEVWNIQRGTRTTSISVPGGPFGLMLEPKGRRLWATLSQDGQVVLIDRLTRTVLETYDVTGIPRRIAYDERGDVVVVTNEWGWLDFFYLSEEPDPGPGPGPLPAKLAIGSRPYGIAASAQGATFVSRLGNGLATRINLATRSAGANITVGLTPTDVAINPAGTRAYVANQGSQSITVIDVATNVAIATIPVTGDPFKVAVSPDGTTLYVGTNAGRAYKLNATTGTLLGSVVTGATPFGFAFGSGNMLYISTWDVGTVVEVNTTTMAVARTFTTGGRAQELAISADLSELYVANEALARVEVWNIAAGTRTTSISVAGGPFGLLLEPDGSHLWTTLAQEGRVALINRTTRNVENTFQVGGTSRRIAYDGATNTAIVTNEGGWLDFLPSP